MVLDPIKHVLRVFLNGFKNIPGKACLDRVHNNYAFVNEPKNAKEERNLIENAIPKSTRAVTKCSVKLLILPAVKLAERTLNMHPPFVVSVSVLISN